MRRLTLIVATIVLVAATAAPVGAAPVNNPQVTTYFLTCDGVTVTVAAKGVPGWDVELVPGTTPALLLGGHLRIWEDGSLVVDGDDPIPPGLTGRLERCRVAGPTWSSPDGPFYVVYDPAFFLFPG